MFDGVAAGYYIWVQQDPQGFSPPYREDAAYFGGYFLKTALIPTFEKPYQIRSEYPMQ